MTFKLADRVKETTTTAGISNVVLGGAYDGYQTFADAIGNAHKTYYVIVDNSNNNWEVGIGTYHSTGNILSRDVVLESSNSDDKISLTGGVSDVFVSYPAEKVVCLNPDSFVSGVAFSGYAFPDGTTQTSAAVEISDTSNLPNAIAIWSDSSALTKDAGFQFITDKFVNNHPTEMNVLSGIPLTITRYASGNFFEAYIDNANDRTLALNLTDEASPTWKLGLKNDPSNNVAPEYGYTYGSNGSAGQAATSDTYTTINYSNGLWFTHKSSNLFNFDKTNGGVIYNATASAPAFTVKGAAAQSANLQEWKNVSDTVVAYLEPDGSISGNALRVSGIIFPDGTTQATTAADGAFSVASGVIQLNLINTNTANITTNADNIVASGTSIIDSSTALTIASGTSIRSGVLSNTTSIGGNTGSITVNRDNIVASGTAIINSYTDLVIASGTAERDLTVASGTSIIGQFSSKANLNSPAFEGTPTAPTAAALTNTTQIATTAFVRTEVTNLVDSAPGTLDTLNELAAALGDDANFSTTVTNSLATKATINNLAGASGALRHDLSLAASSGVDTSGIAFTAYGWGNHASVGYASPTDFALLYASGADTSGIAWTAYNRGDHRALGLVTHSTFGSEGLIKRGSSSGVYTAITDNSSNWNTAYSWGDHTPSGTKHARQIDMLTGSGVATSGIAFDSYAWGDHRTLGLVTHATFGSEGLIKRGSTSGSYSFITDNSSNWNTAYGWGNHASAGYLTSETFTSLVQDTSPQLGGTLDANSQSIDMGDNTITDTKVGQWDTSYGWGDHRALGLVTHATFGSEGIIKRGSTSGSYSFITDNSANWNTAYGWGDHGSAGYLTTATFINGSGTAERADTIASGTAIRSEIKTYTAGSGLVLNDTEFNVAISGDNLLSTNDPVNSYVPSFNASTRKFTWVENAGGGGGGAVSAVANGADNRVVTFSSSDALNGEANLIFDGSQLTVSGEITATTLDIGGIDVTSTAAELNILDGVTSTTAELNILDGVTSTTAELNIVDGDTAATSTTLADADRVVVNDGGTMKQVALTDFETYFESALDTLSNVTSVGTLTALQVDNINIDGNTISSTAGTDLNITPLAGQQIVLDGTIVIDAGVVTGATSITSTAFVGDLTGDVTGNADTATALQTARTIAGKSFDGTGNITIATTDLSDITDLDTDLSSVSSSDDTLASAKAIKTYVDAQVTAQDLDATTDSGTIAIDLDSETLTVAGGTGVDTSATGNTITVEIDSTVATLAGSQTLTNKTLTSPDIDGGTIDNCIIGGNTAAAGTFTSITIGSAAINETELEMLDGITAGTAAANKAVVLDGSKNIATIGTISCGAITSTGSSSFGATSFGDNNITNVGNIALDSISADGSTITITGNTTFADGAYDFDIASHDTSNGLKLGGTLVTATAAELNILDGVTSTTAELNILDGVTSTAAELNILDGATATTSEFNLLDGDTSVGDSITLADSDGFIVNDAGTMKTIPASDIKTYAGGGSFDNFVVTADSGSNQTIADGNTLDIAGGDGITTAVGATDTVTVTADLKANGGLVFESNEIAVKLDASSITGTLAIGDGGTGVTALDDITSANNLLTVTAGADTIIGGDVTLTVNQGNFDLDSIGGSLGLTDQVTGTLPVANGGTGASSLADKAVLITQDSGTDTVSAAVMDANGELLIGGTDGPAVATLTQGSNVTITNGNGTIEIASTQLTTEQVQDIVGGMVTGNTETGISVTYEDGDGTLDFAVGTLNQNTTGNAATATALETGQTIGMTGDVVWTSAAFDGTGAVTGTSTIQANAVDGTMIALGSDAQGDIMYYDGTNYVRLAKGTDNYVLTMNGNVPNWEAAGGGAVSAVANGSDNRIATFSSADALNGEANLTFDGTDLNIATGSIEVRTIDYSDGDNAMTIADGGGVTFAQPTTFSKATKPALEANSDGATVTFDLNEANVHTVTLGGNRTLAISNETAGQCFIIKLIQDGTGSRTVTWFSAINWAGGTAPTLTTTADKADTFGFLCTGTDAYDGFVIGQNIPT